MTLLKLLFSNSGRAAKEPLEYIQPAPLVPHSLITKCPWRSVPRWCPALPGAYATLSVSTQRSAPRAAFRWLAELPSLKFVALVLKQRTQIYAAWRVVAVRGPAPAAQLGTGKGP